MLLLCTVDTNVAGKKHSVPGSFNRKNQRTAQTANRYMQAHVSTLGDQEVFI
jgi:hypothetical protein